MNRENSGERTPNTSNRLRNVALAIGVSVVAALAIVKPWESSPKVTKEPARALVCEGSENHNIRTADGDASNDSVSGIIDSETSRPSDATYLDVIRSNAGVAVTLSALSGRTITLSEKPLPHAIRDGDTITVPSDCTWAKNGETELPPADEVASDGFTNSYATDDGSVVFYR